MNTRGATTRSIEVTWSSWGRAAVVVLAGLAGLWAFAQARHLVSLLLVSAFFGAALVPAVNYLQRERGWRRGVAVWCIYLSGLVALAISTWVLVPSILRLADEIGREGTGWLTGLDAWTSRTFGIHIASASTVEDAVVTTREFLVDWSGKLTGMASSAVTGGISFVISVATVATFTFYLAADFPRLQRALLSWLRPEHQERLGWAIDQSITQVGAYLYSRLLLTLVNATGLFITMVVVGVPVGLAIALAIFGGFISEFIPNIGTYLGGAIPALLTLGIEGLTAAIAVVAYVVIYQQIENYWLSPRISARTMELNGGLAFAAVLAGAELFGPMGAVMALPTTALLVAFTRNYRREYEVSYESRYAPTRTAASPADPPRRSGSIHVSGSTSNETGSGRATSA